MSHTRPFLAVRRSVSAPARAERIAWFVLALLACVLAHEAAYLLMYPGGVAYRAAMTLMGHDAYWMGLALAVAATTIALMVVAALHLRRLRREAGTTPAFAVDEGAGMGAYLGLVGGTWLRLTLLAAIIFTAQENLEALGVGRPMPGVEVVLGHGVLPLLVILAATLPMSLAVGLVRWRRRILLGRLASGAPTWSRDRARRPRSGGSVVTLDRHAPGSWASRAPPSALEPIAL